LGPISRRHAPHHGHDKFERWDCGLPAPHGPALLGLALLIMVSAFSFMALCHATNAIQTIAAFVLRGTTDFMAWVLRQKRSQAPAPARPAA
jgi:hypothetical protein